MSQPIRRLRIAVSGLGRMGARHATHFLHRTPKAELVAAFTPDAKELAWAKEHLEPWGVKIYADFDEMLKHEGLEAVCVATVTTVHAEQSIKAIEAGKHVLCEKPLSTKLDVCQQVLAAAARNPHIKVMCGFSRRFDTSYVNAYALTANGSIGRPTIVRSQTCDRYDPSGFFVAYAEFSGGIFVDCNIHDIDLALWFFSADTKGKVLPRVKSVVAFGVRALEPELAKHGDVDNGVGVAEFYDGQIAYFYSSRMNPPGQHDSTEIIGTKGKLSVNANPTTSFLESHLSTGIHRDIPQTYYDRFEHAFVEEARQFTDAVLENKEVPVDLTSSMEAVRIGVALQDSLRSGKKIWFDREGKRVDEDGLAKAML
ncbi:NAD(P)-binding protein [Cucurbitaria berberidis CBS 394.84]|uniref:NAD(P)-binding protein n=1 Tax=Cucurbitaria berberidis CBS 394.84 TaxID=1168544 RepID=A0A9P4GVS7_9PLEO|nr:NAD(P)-binding protein [Cucurbitaria berberidis CBS 394.84]KAF1852189.1 NAD(P)-binding protein [Cucurbitaria berberidis CBS 394.84]